MAKVHSVIVLFASVWIHVQCHGPAHHHERTYHKEDADIAKCVGVLIQASAYLSSGGMLAASVDRQCKINEPECVKQVSYMTRAFAKAAALSSDAAEHCGGAESGCGFSVSQAVAEISKAAAAATGFWGAYTAKLAEGSAESSHFEPRVKDASSASRGVGEYLQHAADRITDAVAMCEKPGQNESQTPNEIGYCVGEATRAAFDLASAGIQIDGLQRDCPKGDLTTVSKDIQSKCANDAFYVTFSSSTTATHLANVAAKCAKQGKAKCSAKVTDFVKAISRVGIVGSGGDISGYAGALALDDLSDALKTAAVDIHDAVQLCGDDPHRLNEGICVGDALSGATHLAAAGLVISAAAKDCVKKETMDEKIKCANDLMKTMAEVAHASMELMSTAADCGEGKEYISLCGSQVSEGFHVLAKAGTFGAKAAHFAKAASSIDTKSPDFDGLSSSIQAMSDQLHKFSTGMHKADKSCKMVRRSKQPRELHNLLGMSDAHRWLSAGGGDWGKRRQANGGLSYAGFGLIGLFVLVAGLTAMLSVKKFVKARKAEDGNKALQAHVIQQSECEPDDA